MSYDRNNIFAKILRGEVPAHTVYENEYVLAFMDVMPQAPGHTLVIPKAAAETIFDLDQVVWNALTITTKMIAHAVRTAFKPDGVTLMQFNGAVAGQTVFHMHMHVIPRYADSPLRTHAREMADSALLTAQAIQLKHALTMV